MIRLKPITKTIGLEIPNSNVKLVTNNHQPVHYLNTVQVVDETNKKLNELLNITIEDVWEYEGDKCLVGLPSGSGSGGLSISRYSSREFRRECAFAIAHIVKTPNEIINVVTGVPADDYENEEIINSIINNLKGSYEVFHGKIRRTFQVDNVLVVPQPIGTLLSHFFTEDQKQKVEDRLLTMDWLVCDIGWGTTDFCIANALSGVSRMDTIAKGMSNIFRDMLDRTHKKYPRKHVKR